MSVTTLGWEHWRWGEVVGARYVLKGESVGLQYTGFEGERNQE